ncbi:MAG: hypothetical protein RL300_1672, partial [Pseudomonadota bacterium]
MNDIRRTILWVIFGFSMVMLWDQWQVYNGHKPTFFPGPPTAAVQPKGPASAASVPTGVPAVAAPAVSAAQITGTAPAVAQPASAPVAARERIEAKTDVLKLTFDTEGASLVRAEFLKHIDMADKSRNVVLLDES